MYYPFVSIIIPVLNNQEGLSRALFAIDKQTYPKSNFEVIIVDNASNKSPKEIAIKYGFTYLEEYINLNSPYSSRNRGLEVAKGEIIVLLDTTCAPTKFWIEEGVKAIQSGCDLVGGNVVFEVNKKSTLGEMYDSLISVRMKESILKKNVATTTNLFLHKRVLDRIGYFPEKLRSGGDIRWTGKATSQGFKLCFSETAKVFMKTRRLSLLISKQYRVSKGMPAIWKERGGFTSNFIKKGILFMLPPNPYRLIKLIESNNFLFMKKHLFSLIFIGYLLRITAGAGIWVELLKLESINKQLATLIKQKK